MRRNKQKKGVHVSFVQPIMVSILMATSVPLITLAAVREDADLGADSPIFSTFNPRADQTSLFDAAEFRAQRRMRHSLASDSSKASVSSSASSSSVPCADHEVDVSASSSSVRTMLRFDDLSTSQQAELRKQLRIGGCPYDVLPGYRELCELMLQQRQSVHPAAVVSPLRNPYQETVNENLPKDETR